MIEIDATYISTFKNEQEAKGKLIEELKGILSNIFLQENLKVSSGLGNNKEAINENNIYMDRLNPLNEIPKKLQYIGVLDISNKQELEDLSKKLSNVDVFSINMSD